VTPRPVLILAAVGAGGTAATGVLAGVPDVPRWLTLSIALVTAVSVAVGGVLVQGQVTPNAKVAAEVAPPGSPANFVAGPAAPLRNGLPVDVTAAGPSTYGDHLR
jgi:hypothetical protein